MEFYLPGKWTWKNLIIFECSQKGECVLLPHDYFYEILFIGCSKFTVEIRSMAGRNKMAFTCSVSIYVCLAVGQSVLLHQRKIVSLVN